MTKAALLSPTAFAAVFLALMVPLAAAQSPSQPEVPMSALADGNQWTYVCQVPGQPSSAVFQDVRVTGHVDERNLRLSRVENYMFPGSDRDVLFYNDPCAKTCEVNPHFLGHEGRPHPTRPLRGPWYPCQYGCKLGETIELPQMDSDCVHGTRGHVTKIGAPITVPAGTFPWSITITYDEWPCCDDQVLTETLVPKVGLVHRTVARLPGVQEWSLCFAVLNGKVLGSPGTCRPETASERGAAALEPATWGTVKSFFRN